MNHNETVSTLKKTILP